MIQRLNSLQTMEGGNIERIEICAICKGLGFFESTCEFCHGSGEFNPQALALWKYHRCYCYNGYCDICLTKCHCLGEIK